MLRGLVVEEAFFNAKGSALIATRSRVRGARMPELLYLLTTLP